MTVFNDILTLISEYKTAYIATYTTDKEKYLTLRGILCKILYKMDSTIRDLEQYETADYSLLVQTVINLLVDDSSSTTEDSY